MTGPEHYREAERLVETVDTGHWVDTELSIEQLLAMAQVHATLAHTAAVALAAPTCGDDNAGFVAADEKAWSAVAATEPVEGGAANA